ncbi:MAG: ferritin-like domain-containing protein, partial [Acidimicrobiia bacterium]
MPTHEPVRVPRRRLLRIGGTTIAAAAVLAACRPTGDDDPGTDERARPSSADRELLRTASSLDELALAVYERASGSGLVTTSDAMNTLELFRRHHREHAELFARATADAGGEPFREPNPVVMASLRPALDAATDEAAVLALALDVERLLAETYQSFAGAFTDRSFDVATMSVGGTEARHAAVIAPFVG